MARHMPTIMPTVATAGASNGSVLGCLTRDFALVLPLGRPRLGLSGLLSSPFVGMLSAAIVAAMSSALTEGAGTSDKIDVPKSATEPIARLSDFLSGIFSMANKKTHKLANTNNKDKYKRKQPLNKKIYAERLKVIKKYRGVNFRNTINFTGPQKSWITKQFKKYGRLKNTAHIPANKDDIELFKQAGYPTNKNGVYVAPAKNIATGEYIPTDFKIKNGLIQEKTPGRVTITIPFPDVESKTAFAEYPREYMQGILAAHWDIFKDIPESHITIRLAFDAGISKVDRPLDLLGTKNNVWIFNQYKDPSYMKNVIGVRITGFKPKKQTKRKKGKKKHGKKKTTRRRTR